MILISPYSRKLADGRENPKNYPYWEELIELISEKSNGNEALVQVGLSGEKQLINNFKCDLSLQDLADLIIKCRVWISVDSFFQHYAWSLGKPGIVLWGQSDPNIYGHKENDNLLMGREFLMPDQFVRWEDVPYKKDCFVSPKTVISYI